MAMIVKCAYSLSLYLIKLVLKIRNRNELLVDFVNTKAGGDRKSVSVLSRCIKEIMQSTITVITIRKN